MLRRGPFAAHLPFDVTMLRQDVQAVISEAFALAEKYGPTDRSFVFVPMGFGNMFEEAEETTAGYMVLMLILKSFYAGALKMRHAHEREFN